MCFTATQCDQPTLRANIRRNQAPLPRGQELRHQIQREVMGTNAEDGPFKVGFTSIQMNPDLFACFESLCAARNNGQAIGLHQRSNDACTTRQRRGEQPCTHFSSNDPHIIIITGR